ncbi:MAG: DUF5615 family PIN-like protein [Chloroflexota bacterium]
MPEPRLHLDADISRRSVHQALQNRGHDVTRTPNDWIAEDASDELQLLQATARGRVIATHNVGDFVRLARRFPQHGRVVLVHQFRMNLSELVAAFDRMLRETGAADWPGQVRWLGEWRVQD